MKGFMSGVMSGYAAAQAEVIMKQGFIFDLTARLCCRAE
jgi:hypothetical protein